MRDKDKFETELTIKNRFPRWMPSSPSETFAHDTLHDQLLAVRFSGPVVPPLLEKFQLRFGKAFLTW